MSVNVKRMFLGLRQVLPVMLKQKRGAIVNTASTHGLIGPPGMSAYVASKHAVIGLTKTAAGEVARSGVRVNAVCPGAVDTAMIHRLESAISPDDPGGFGDRCQSALPTGRYGTADEIANLVLFLCSDLASNITGAQYVSDGGLHCNGWFSDGQLGFSLALDSGLQLNVIEYIASAILRPNILRNFQRNHHDSPHSPPQTSGQPARRNGAMMELSEDRIEQLEKLVSSLRHDVRGIVTPVALAAHHLHKRGDHVSQHSAAMIDKMIERLVLRLNSTYGLVPPSSGVAAAPLSLLVSHAVDEAKAPIPAA